jgi:hypothetical protein
MRMLDFWRKVPKRLPSAPLKSIVPLAGRKDRKPAGILEPASALRPASAQKPASTLARARLADTDGRARRRNQLVEDSRLL